MSAGEGEGAVSPPCFLATRGPDVERSAIRQIDFALPSPHLESANWVDSFERIVPAPTLSASDAVDAMFGPRPPLWVRLLNDTRNLIVGGLGLKKGQISVDEGQAGAFPVVFRSPDTVVMGFDDWHLDFRVVTRTRRVPAGTAVSVSTLVRRRHWFGYLYLFLITPFHKRIVRRLLSNLA
ncbi:DUF2867 domain-containing protein [Stappia sp.]|uniref:DUF2867 domain-containing protein n=1 Tax=Stappia sp. TaxID=1870903 RepID=UPI0025E2CF59|nr:DUF2867 domain-containing protein [Stappia sp.]